MLVIGGHPADAIQIYSEFVFENSPGPQSGGDCVSAIDCYLVAFQVFGIPYARLHIVELGPVMKVSGKEHRNGRDGLALIFGAQISGEGHFTNVELEALTIRRIAPVMGATSINSGLIPWNSILRSFDLSAA